MVNSWQYFIGSVEEIIDDMWGKTSKVGENSKTSAISVWNSDRIFFAISVKKLLEIYVENYFGRSAETPLAVALELFMLLTPTK